MRRGLRIVWRGIRDEPGMFSIAVAGSAVYGIGTAGAGWVLGRLVENVVAPAFAARSITAGQLAFAVGSLALVAVLTAVGIVARRAAGGVSSTGCRRTTAAPSPASTSACRCPGTSGTRRPAAVQRQRRRRGRLGADRAAADGGRHVAMMS